RAEEDAPGLWAALGTIASRVGRRDVAVDAWEHVIALRPEDARAYLRLAEALVAARRIDDAEQWGQAALGLASASEAMLQSSARRLLAAVSLARGDADEARAEALAAADRDPALVPYVDARLQFDDGNYAEAVPLFQKAIERLGPSPAAPMRNLHAELG